jgi:hypothetical protein
MASNSRPCSSPRLRHQPLPDGPGSASSPFLAQPIMSLAARVELTGRDDRPRSNVEWAHLFVILDQLWGTDLARKGCVRGFTRPPSLTDLEPGIMRTPRCAHDPPIVSVDGQLKRAISRS